MLAHEVLKAAAEIVRAGWSEGGVPARDVDGREVHLYGHAIGGSSRVGINPAAARFSAYGAVAKVLNGPGVAAVDTNAIWGKLSDAARAHSPARPGGTNFMHPLVQFNADPERTDQDIINLLLEVAAVFELEANARAEAIQAGRAT